MAPRLRAAEEALALLARAARLVSRPLRAGADRPPGGRSSSRRAYRIIRPSLRRCTGTRRSCPPRSSRCGPCWASALQRSGKIVGRGCERVRRGAREQPHRTSWCHRPRRREWRVVAPDHGGLCDLSGVGCRALRPPAGRGGPRPGLIGAPPGRTADAGALGGTMAPCLATASACTATRSCVSDSRRDRDRRCAQAARRRHDRDDVRGSRRRPRRKPGRHPEAALRLRRRRRSFRRSINPRDHAVIR